MSALNKLISIALIMSTMLMISCKEEPANTPVTPKERVKIPAFNADSAYSYVEKQLSFGPRVPGSVGHIACKEWLVQQFKASGADVIEQDFTAIIHTGDKWPSTNIIAQFNPKHKNRVILSAHWDTRYIGEEDPDRKKRDQPIPGADDGGSGVAVLLEIARVLANNPIDLGVDIILWDAEDQGKRGANQPPQLWCLGSQHWSKNKHRGNYIAKYGINLDMVGAKNARFGKEEFSRKYAGKILDKVWKLGQNMGYSDMFSNNLSAGITDDHYFINTMAGIPMINVINQPDGSSFVPHWHKHSDDIQAIDKRTLRIVGQIMLATIFKESDGSL